MITKRGTFLRTYLPSPSILKVNMIWSANRWVQNLMINYM